MFSARTLFGGVLAALMFGIAYILDDRDDHIHADGVGGLEDGIDPVSGKHCVKPACDGGVPIGWWRAPPDPRDLPPPPPPVPDDPRAIPPPPDLRATPPLPPSYEATPVVTPPNPSDTPQMPPVNREQTPGTFEPSDPRNIPLQQATPEMVLSPVPGLYTDEMTNEPSREGFVVDRDDPYVVSRDEPVVMEDPNATPSNTYNQPGGYSYDTSGETIANPPPGGLVEEEATEGGLLFLRNI